MSSGRRCPDLGACHHSCQSQHYCWRRDEGGCSPVWPFKNWSEAAIACERLAKDERRGGRDPRDRVAYRNGWIDGFTFGTGRHKPKEEPADGS